MEASKSVMYVNLKPYDFYFVLEINNDPVTKKFMDSYGDNFYTIVGKYVFGLYMLGFTLDEMRHVNINNSQIPLNGSKGIFLLDLPFAFPELKTITMKLFENAKFINYGAKL